MNEVKKLGHLGSFVPMYGFAACKKVRSGLKFFNSVGQTPCEHLEQSILGLQVWLCSHGSGPKLVKSQLRLSTVFVIKVKNDHRSKFSNLSNWKEEAWKNQGFNGIRTCDLHDTGAMLYQLSYEATHWERGQFIEFISPVRSENDMKYIWITSYLNYDCRWINSYIDELINSYILHELS